MSNATRPRRAVPIRSHQVNAPASPIWDEIRAAAQQGVYLATLVLAAVSAALLIAPVGYHRTVFRQRLRPQLVNTGHRSAIAGIPDQSGRVAVVTGANGGLGLEVARALAARGAQVVMAARDQAKAEAARASIRENVPDARLELRPLDLASQASVRKAAAAILADHPTIDLLVNNAGVMGISERRTEDGFEMQLAVNHLGHFALTAQLIEALLRSGDARVVSVTSTGRHTGGPLDPANPHLVGSYEPWRAYGQSKMANVHFALELERRFRAADVPARSIVVHPGFANTDLQARSVRETGGGRSQRFFHAAVRRFGMTPAQGALTLLRAATDPGAVGGALYTPRWVNWGPPVRRPLFRRARDRDAMATLWAVSERETGVTFEVEAPA